MAAGEVAVDATSVKQDFMSDVFDDVTLLLTPERLLRDPRATGAGVKVAIIDSGVERALL